MQMWEHCHESSRRYHIPSVVKAGLWGNMLHLYSHFHILTHKPELPNVPNATAGLPLAMFPPKTRADVGMVQCASEGHGKPPGK